MIQHDNVDSREGYVVIQEDTANTARSYSSPVVVGNSFQAAGLYPSQSDLQCPRPTTKYQNYVDAIWYDIIQRREGCMVLQEDTARAAPS